MVQDQPKVKNNATVHPETVAKAETLAKETEAREKSEKKARKSKPRQHPADTKVEKTKVVPVVWQKALELAKGDAKRIRVESETSVVVRNPGHEQAP